MRICVVSADTGIPVFGQKGGSVHVQAVICALRRAGYAVHLFTSCLGGAPEQSSDLIVTQFEGMPIREPEHRATPTTRARIAALNARIAALLESESENGPFAMVYERYSLWSHAAMEFAHTAQVPGVLEINAPLIEEQNSYRTTVDARLARAVSAKAFRKAKVLIAVSRQVAQYLEQFGEAQGKVRVVPNGADVSRFPVRRVTQQAAHFTIVFVGTFKPWHGLDTLLRAMALLKSVYADIKLLIVGDGPEASRIRSLVSNTGLTPIVRFTGSVPPSEIPRLLRSAALAVAPYSDIPGIAGFYFSPLKLFEYMAAGLPVVASALGQIVEILEHRVSGWLVPPDDPDALAEAVVHLRSHPSLMGAIAQAARAKVLHYYAWDVTCARILKAAGVP